MQRIGTDSLADLKLTLQWQGATGQHREVYNAFQVNFWRDIFPRDLYHGLMGKGPNDRVNISFEAGTSLVGYHPRSILTIKKPQFQMQSDTGHKVPARLGRFYPKGMLCDVVGVYPQNVEPFRCVGIENGHLVVDFNHPLLGKQLSLSAEVQNVYPKAYERGGNSTDWVEILTYGPGMQSRWRQQPTDFFTPNAFDRLDAAPDDLFYAKPRYVHHLDVTARGIITNTYKKLLPQGGRVLDLMSSWVSHLPEDTIFEQVVGIGLNADELAENRRLDEYVVHDLNHSAHLPFEDGIFNGVICTVSIEYLTDPASVFSEVARVLAPEGVFVITFSNRWFAPKAVNIWSQLHEFERMGLIMEYFLRSERFHTLNTYSHRGLPRDSDDKYYGQLPYADPVYAVWGYRL